MVFVEYFLLYFITKQNIAYDFIFIFVEYKQSTHLSEAILSRDFLVNQRNLFLDQFYMVLTPSYGSFLLAWHCAGPEIHCTRTTDVFDVNPQRIQ